MPKPIEDLPDAMLATFIRNYEEQGKTTGGIYPLADLLVERLRRKPTIQSPGDVFRFVVETARRSADGKITYKEVWNFLYPGQAWSGNNPRKVVGSHLGSVIAYSVRNGLPIVSTLVVKGNDREHSEGAIQNIYNECKAYGVEVGTEPRAFVLRERERAKAFDLSDLP